MLCWGLVVDMWVQDMFAVPAMGALWGFAMASPAYTVLALLIKSWFLRDPRSDFLKNAQFGRRMRLWLYSNL